MKYIFIFSILIMMLSSCIQEDPKLPNAERAAYISQVGTYIYKVTVEGHDYFYSYRTGMIHSESCKSPEHYDSYKH